MSLDFQNPAKFKRKKVKQRKNTLTLLGLEAVPTLGAVWLCSLVILALFVKTQVCRCCEGCEGMVSGCMKEQL